MSEVEKKINDDKSGKAAPKPEKTQSKSDKAKVRVKKKKIQATTKAIFYINAGINNTIVSLTDLSGNVIAQMSCGKLGFKNSKKSTPYAHQKVLEIMINQAHDVYGVREIKIVIRGYGQAREMLMFLQNNYISIESITDNTNLPYNGVRQPRERRN